MNFDLFSRFVLSLTRTLAIPALAFSLFSCERNAPEDDAAIIRSPEKPPAATASSPSTSLPQSGDITTSTGVASTPGRRQLTPEEQAKALDLMMNRLADRQSRGLGAGHVRVNGAWQYDGYSYLSPNPASEIPARMVAVDLTVEGHTADFDPDDIEIVDGISKISYGSDPHLTFLKAPGEPVASPKEIPVAPNATRMLLIYAFPESSQKFTLYYWGKELLAEPLTFADSGWGLPFPEKE